MNSLTHISCTALMLTVSLQINAQQVDFIDLTSTTQRVELRFPPAPPSTGGVHGGGGFSIACGAPNIRDPRGLGLHLETVDFDDAHPREPFDVQFKVLNTGTIYLELPVYAHLSDLQPSDPWKEFDYLSLALAVDIAGRQGSTGHVELYGSDDHPGTVRVLQPGEWLVVKARLSIKSLPPPAAFLYLQAGFWIHRTTHIPQAGGFFSKINNIYLNATATPSVKLPWIKSAVNRDSAERGEIPAGSHRSEQSSLSRCRS